MICDSPEMNEKGSRYALAALEDKRASLASEIVQLERKLRHRREAPTQAELASKANVGLSTVKDYEGGKRTPIANNLEALKKALESAGMTFTTDSVRGPIQ